LSDFKPAVEELIRNYEGGFQCRPDDPGNWTGGIDPQTKHGIGELKGTKYGISAHSFPDVDIKNLTLEAAEALYERDWWKYGDINDQAIANKMLSLAVNWERFGGHGPAVTVLQKAIVNCSNIPVVIDGELGPRTLTACNNCDPLKLLREIRQQALLHYQEIERNHPEEHAWFKGWEERALA
jgi:lysozyme family protein